MRILYATNSAKMGGAEQHLLFLIEGMVKRGHQVYLVCPEGEMVGAYLNAGALLRIDKPRLDIDPLYILRMAKFLWCNKIEVLHVHQLKTVVNCLIGAKLARTPLKIAHVHSPITKWQIPWYKKIPDLVMNFLAINYLADVAIALTEAAWQQRVRGERIFKNKVKVIPNGIDIKKFKVQRSEFKIEETLNKKTVVGTLSRLTEEKGINVFIQAVSKIPEDKRKDFSFVIAGDGPLKAGLEDLSRNLGVKDKIKFLGFIPEEKKGGFYRSLEIFVFPTLHEGFGYVLAEAMASGAPTISSDLEVLKELTVQGEFGYHFKANDSEDLSRVIIRVAKKAEERSFKARKAQEHIEKKYSLERFISSYETLYKR